MTERQRIIDAVKAWAAREPLISAVDLFGSFAKGTQTPRSDVDLALTIEADGMMRPLGVYIENADRWREDLRGLLGRDVDVEPLSEATKIVAPAVAEHGIRIYP